MDLKVKPVRKKALQKLDRQKAKLKHWRLVGRLRGGVCLSDETGNWGANGRLTWHEEERHVLLLLVSLRSNFELLSKQDWWSTQNS